MSRKAIASRLASTLPDLAVRLSIAASVGRRKARRVPSQAGSIATTPAPTSATPSSAAAPYTTPYSNLVNIDSSLHFYRRQTGRYCLSPVYHFHNNAAFILRIPCATPSSFKILKTPSPPVRSACGPPQNSIEYAESRGPTDRKSVVW